MRKKYIIAVVVAVGMLLGTLQAQNYGPRGVNRSLHEVSTATVHMPGTIDYMFFYGGGLRVKSGDMRFFIPVEGIHFGVMQIDTALSLLGDEVVYAVTNPANGNVFFVEQNSKGNTTLNEVYDKGKGKKAVRKIRLSGFSYKVEHPVFTKDGNVMVFSSDCPLGFGGNDLWYSVLDNDKWSYPQNMGRTVNTTADESCPVMYGDFMIYATSGFDGGYGGTDFYATRVSSFLSTEGTVGGLMLAAGDVQSLDRPFCSEKDERFFVVADGGVVAWLSTDTVSGDLLQAVYGRMDCVRLSGVLALDNGTPVEGSMVVVAGDSVACDTGGRYCLYLQPGEAYDFAFSAPGCFTVHKTLTLTRANNSNIFFDDCCNITLFAYIADSVYSFVDLFASSVSSELSISGRSRLDFIVRFLNDNPGYRVSVASAYYGSADIAFCELLNGARNSTVIEYLRGKGVSRDRMEVMDKVPRLIDYSNETMQTFFFVFKK